MKFILHKSTLLLLLASMLLSWSAFSQTTINAGTISSNTTWTKNNSPYYLAGDITVAEGVTLRVQPGVVVKFKDHYTDLVINGRLVAQGTASEQVVFTAFADDAHGGDTNNDGSATQPAPDQWGAIWFGEHTAENVLEYTWLGYGGGYYTSAMVNTSTSGLKINHVTFAHSAERGLYAKAACPPISNSAFINNGTDGIYFDGLDKDRDLIMSNNTFTGNTNFAVLTHLKQEQVNLSLTGNSSVGSAHNGFALKGSISGNMQWKSNATFPIIIQEDVTVLAEGLLSIYANTVVKFNDHYDDLVIEGSLQSMGVSEAPVYFTSLANDQVGGDTNGDGAESSPTPDQWGAIWLLSGSTNNLLQFTNISYGGGYYSSAMINIASSETALLNCTISHSAERGVYTDKVSPGIKNCNFIDNATDGLYMNQLDKEKAFILENNAFTRNTNFAVLAYLNQEESDISLLRNLSFGSAHNGFAVSGSLAGDVQWASNEGFPFVIQDDVTIMEGARLTLTPGSTLKFNDHYDDLIVNGTLNAVGKAEAQVVFTSIADDTVDGDTNGDADATFPAGDQWGAIWFAEQSTQNRMTHSWIGYGGGYYTSAIINTSSSDLELRHSVVANSAERGVYVDRSSPVFYDCLFLGNATDGIYINQLDKTDDFIFEKNSFIDNVNFAVLAHLDQETRAIQLSENSSSGSDHNGFAVYGSLAGDVQWTSNEGFPFVIQDDVMILEGARLTLTPGSTLKFNDHYDDLIVNGTLNAVGTATDEIRFTSIADDTVDGDTNGDADATFPAGDQWGAIWFGTKSDASVLDYAFIGYGGGYYTSAMVNITEADIKIKHSTLTGSPERAIYIDTAYPHLERNRIYGNVTGIFTTKKSLPALYENDIYDNSAFGIQNGDASVNVDAWNTWWGDATGPEHATLNPNGKGNPVSDHVLFQPWLTSPATGTSTSIGEVIKLPFAFGQLTPNPFYEEIQLEFSLEKATYLRLEVLNSNGQRLYQLENAWFPAGIHTHRWQTTDLPAGYYFFRLSSADGQLAVPVVKM